MIRTIIFFLLAGLLVIIGLSSYLSPDDLRTCNDAPSGTSPCQSADAIVAISGGDTSARTHEAIRLYQAGWSETLIFSGAARDKSGPSNAAAMRLEALEAGVPESAIIVEEYGETTRQNAEKTLELLKAKDVKSVILVTSPYHQRRAYLEFTTRVGDTISVINHPATEDHQWSGLWWLTPQGWYLAVGEFIKIIAFYIGGTR